ncbi:NAD(P)-dependent oxidoreductase [Chroococcidiopsis sp. FACHB-1243]|uniref:NAD(P)-dependent oxidoreductase n=1 Tax=Chroococcidiopsis sp. [FACHB-1243] TaxID=2692781 RepID=UPI001786853E|nr:NAD(P)-dependent oxidoreductase [Chroococcidiopsis sp. [FACHB-1243]]MBD2306031.1 NAD(P)-dependent oxidoreductase [Chroococcidiopsis sp. [FACHB-1243]]
MKLALFGANGMAGSRIATEALMCGHDLTAIVRDLSRFSPSARQTPFTANIVVGNVLDPTNVAELVQGHDAVISTIGPGADKASDPILAQDVIKATHSLIEGLTRATVRRLVVVGGAGSLEVESGLRLVDTPDFPEIYRPASLAHCEALDIYKTCDLDWTFISPAAFFEPGERTGKYRIGTDQLLVDATGKSQISAEDYALALLDEVERSHFLRRRMTVAY